MRPFALLALVFAAAAPAAAGELRAGVGKVDITPPLGTPLGGYAARKGVGSTSIHDPIYAKALVLDDGETRLALITSDLVGSNPEMVKRVAQASGFPQDRMMVTASHTHSGPGAYGKGAFAAIVLGLYREDVFRKLEEGMTQALKQAVADLKPAALAIGQRDLPQFMRNRRKLKVKDPALWTMRVDTADGKPLAALVNLTAHGTVLDDDNLGYSGDWMAYTQSFLEREVPGLTSLYTNGAEGDVSPNIPDNTSNIEGAKAHGEKGGRAALELYQSLKPAREVKLAARNSDLDLPQTLSSALLGAGKQTRLQVFTINDAAMIAVPGEPITQLGLILKEHARRQGFAHPIIVGLANDHLGYFLTETEMKKGGYEAKVSFFGNRFGEELTLALAALVGGETEPVKEALRKANEAGKTDQ